MAIAIKVRNQVSEPYNFGAVVVMKDKISAQTHGNGVETYDPTLHAEVGARCTKIPTNEKDIIMKIGVIGSMQYTEKMLELRDKLIGLGHDANCN